MIAPPANFGAPRPDYAVTQSTSSEGPYGGGGATYGASPSAAYGGATYGDSSASPTPGGPGPASAGGEAYYKVY